MRLNPVQKLLSFPASRHEPNPQTTTITKLGFPLMGLNSENGPVKAQLPKPIRCVSNLFLITPKSDLNYVLAKPSQWLCRVYKLNGRGLHTRSNSQSLLWICFNHPRTMALESLMSKLCKPHGLKFYGMCFPTPNSQSFVCDSTPIHHSMATLAINFKHPSTTILFRTLVLIFAKALLREVLLVPARSTSLAPSSTLLCLLTVTKLSSTDLFVEELSTILDLTCTTSLSSVWLKALIEPLLMYFIYPLIYLIMALGNAFHCCTLNLRSRYPFILVLGFYLN
ncbi:unnamed protein product [Arabidopsis halleri]